MAHRDSQRPHIAVPLCREASELFETTGDDHGAAWTQTILGWPNSTRATTNPHGTGSSARTRFLRANDSSGAAWSSIFSARSDRGSKRQADAREHCERALEQADDSGDRKAAIWALNELGTADLRSGKVEQAIVSHQRALAISREVPDRYAEARTLDELATALARSDRHTEARDFWNEAIGILDRLNSPYAHHARRRRDAHITTPPA